MTEIAEFGDVNTVELSQNETENLCLKAARGAGFSWGLAEEAGFAAGTLAAQGIDATAPLLSFLTEKLTVGVGTPRPMAGHWQSTDHLRLCPITLGAALCDAALLPDGPFGQETRFDPVAYPILLLPFIVRAAQISSKAVVIDWQDGHIRIAANGAFDRLAALHWTQMKDLAMTLRQGADIKVKQGCSIGLAAISTASLEGLNALALKTTVPATDTSRRGAGSATADND
jgi:hypothetical protein